jgi:large subunit ribosomal protein L35
MPKIKTRKGAAKRFKLAAGGQVRRGRANKNHLLGGKSRKRKRRLRQATVVASADSARIRQQLVRG